MPDIFISYSRTDIAVMREVRNYLISKDISVWSDQDAKLSHWQSDIERAITDCLAVIILMSPESKASEAVNTEIQIAHRAGKKLIPIFVRGDDQSAIPFWCEIIDRVDIRVDSLEIQKPHFARKLREAGLRIIDDTWDPWVTQADFSQHMELTALSSSVRLLLVGGPDLNSDHEQHLLAQLGLQLEPVDGADPDRLITEMYRDPEKYINQSNMFVGFPGQDLRILRIAESHKGIQERLGIPQQGIGMPEPSHWAYLPSDHRLLDEQADFDLMLRAAKVSPIRFFRDRQFPAVIAPRLSLAIDKDRPRGLEIQDEI